MLTSINFEKEVLIEKDYFNSLPEDERFELPKNKTLILVSKEVWELSNQIETVNPSTEMEIVDILSVIIDYQIKYNESDNTFYFFDGKKYVPDPNGAKLDHLVDCVGHLACSLNKCINEQLYALNISSNHLSNHFKWFRKCLAFVKKTLCNSSASRIVARMQRRAEEEPVVMDDPNKTGHLLNCQNGILDLKTHTLYKHSHEYYITHITNCNYDPDAKSQEMYDFWMKLMNNDQKHFERFFQLRGQALDESLVLKAMEIDIGINDCGKTTANDVLSGTLGLSTKSQRGYICYVNPQYLTAQATSGGACTPALEMMPGCKMIVMTEPDGDYMPNSSQIKALTGGNQIFVNPKFKSAYQIKINGLLIWETNHFFKLDDPIIFDRGSAQIMPFEHQFTAQEKDPTIASRLLSSETAKSALLNYLIEGYDSLISQNRVFTTTDHIQDLTETYRNTSDEIGSFLKDNYSFTGDNADRIKFCDAYNKYKSWSIKMGYATKQNADFCRALSSRSIEVTIYRHQKYIVGYSEKSTSSDKTA